jgi:heme/copper-type cytochrome/quinol oxidase subunit 4
MAISKLTKIWIGLVLLTLVSFIGSMTESDFKVAVILILALVKFIAVSFYFMELKSAHTFWKASVLIFVLLFISLALILI